MPRGSGIVTRRPLVLQLINSPQGIEIFKYLCQDIYCYIKKLHKLVFYDELELHKQTSLNAQTCNNSFESNRAIKVLLVLSRCTFLLCFHQMEVCI